MGKVEILRAACCIAGADQHATNAERKLLNRLAEQAGVGKVSQQAMIERATSDPHFFEEQFSSISADPDTTIKTLLVVAVADHDLSTDERVILQTFAHRLNMDDKRFDQLLRVAEKHIASMKAKKS